jgi:hypothetical protein
LCKIDSLTSLTVTIIVPSNIDAFRVLEPG